MRMSYEPVRRILFLSAGFCLFGPLPRALGIIQTKPEHSGWVPYMDAAAAIVFGVSLVWAFFAMVHNARKEGA